MKLNENYFRLKDSYLFSEIAQRVREYSAANPNAKIIRLGIGDVTRPLAPCVVDAMKSAAVEMGDSSSFRGYGPEQGYDFLRGAIARYYAEKNVALADDEIFISDGAKSDLGNILDLFDSDNTVLVPDPVYPVYVDTNIMAGRRVIFADANEANGFLPMPDNNIDCDIVYICSPNNPTGAVYTKKQLKEWVTYAINKGAVILFDAAYEAFIHEDDCAGEDGLARSIYEIEGAGECAIEFCSFSKTAGFTGTRCGYTAVPHALKIGGRELNKLWLRRQTTKFNGVPYIVQRGAQAVFTPEGREQIAASIDYYRANAKTIMAELDNMGITYTGGKNSPYVWLRCPGGMKSWEFFDLLLKEANVVGTPGIGFGRNGEGYFRLTSFGNAAQTALACERIRNIGKSGI
ncbi:MAG: LL-diaminopimelate aminotransferase [Eubacteriales bacterium]